ALDGLRAEVGQHGAGSADSVWGKFRAIAQTYDASSDRRTEDFNHCGSKARIACRIAEYDQGVDTEDIIHRVEAGDSVGLHACYIRRLKYECIEHFAAVYYDTRIRLGDRAEECVTAFANHDAFVLQCHGQPTDVPRHVVERLARTPAVRQDTGEQNKGKRSQEWPHR